MPLEVSGAQKELQWRQLLDQFKEIFGLELKQVPDAEERFFMTEFVRQRIIFLVNVTNGVRSDLAAFLTSAPSEDRKGVEESLRRLAEMRETAARTYFDFMRARDVLVDLGFEDEHWGLSIDDLPTIRKPASTTPPTP
jgi:hypothetical protein